MRILLVEVRANAKSPETRHSERLCESDEKGPDARGRSMAAREAYFLYVERAAKGANEADGPFSSL
jgi:hypothetical protein